MNRLIIFVCTLIVHFTLIAAVTGSGSDYPVVLNSGLNSHLIDAKPEATIGFASGALTVTLDATHYASYTVTLTSPAGDSVTVNATSPTVTIPVNGDSDGYVVTIDGGDYGTYDGVFSRSGASTVTLTDQQALRLVKNRRKSVPSDGVLQYSATVNKIINDAACPVMMPLDAVWPNDTACAKWLIFSDQPATENTMRQCSYAYIPKTLSVSDTVPFAVFESHAQSPSMRLKPLNFTFDMNMLQCVQFPNGSPSMPIPNNLRVIIVHDYTDVAQSPYDYIKRWNECCQFYLILTQLYGVPKSHIQVVMSSFDTYYETNQVLPHDFDGDGIDEFDGSLTLQNALDSISNDVFDELIIYYANYADYPINMDYPAPYLQIPENLEEQINAKSFTYFLSCNNAEWYFETYQDDKTLLISGASENFTLKVHPSLKYYWSPFYWLSAMAHMNLITGAPIQVSVDTDSNGHDSFGEICAAAINQATWEYYNGVEYERDGGVTWPLDVPGADINLWSLPFSLQDSLGLSMLPRDFKLDIRQTNASIPDSVTWNSPDIWVRGDNNGLVYQEGASFKAFENSHAYIYTKVTNNGSVAYTGGRKLHLFWDKPHLGIPGVWHSSLSDYDMWSVASPNYIGSIELTDTILPGSSVIKKYDWIIPQSVAALGEGFGNIFSASIGAFICDGDYTDLASAMSNARLRHRMVKKNEVLVNPILLPRKSISLAKGAFGLDMFTECEDYCTVNIVLIADSTSVGSIFTAPRKNVYWQFPDNEPWFTNNTTESGSNPTTYTLTNQYARANLEAYGDENNPMNCGLSYSSYPGVGNIDQKLHMILKKPDGSYTEGHTLHIKEDTINSGGGGGITPGIRSVRGMGQDYTLTATGVLKPASFEWLDSEFKKVEDGQTVTVNRNEIGDVCVLRVTIDEDGTEAYAIATLDGVPAMESVSPVPLGADMTVRLTDAALQGMSVRIISVMGSTATIESVFTEGDYELTIATASLPSGQYVVCLVYNGKIVQSVNVVK